MPKLTLGSELYASFPGRPPFACLRVLEKEQELTFSEDERVFLWTAQGGMALDLNGGATTTFLRGNDVLLLRDVDKLKLTYTTEHTPVVALSVYCSELGHALNQFPPAYQEGGMAQQMTFLRAREAPLVFEYPEAFLLVSSIESCVFSFSEENYPFQTLKLLIDISRMVIRATDENGRHFAPITTMENMDVVVFVIGYIRDVPTATLHEVSRILHYNRDYLSGLLVKSCGYSFSQLQARRRTATAHYLLLNTDLPPQEIAVQLGYQSYSGFYRMFKKKYHISPAEYREIHKDYLPDNVWVNMAENFPVDPFGRMVDAPRPGT